MVALYEGRQTVETVLSTTLNSLADGNNVTSAALSNDAATTERRLFGNFRLTLAATSTRTGTPMVDLYIISEVDATYGMGASSSSVDPLTGYRGSFPLDAATTAREQTLDNVLLPNSNFKVVLVNSMGVAFAASGSTLKLERESYEDV